MAAKFLAPVIALALLVIASSVGKLPGEKSLLSQRKIPCQLMFGEKRAEALDNQMAREAEHVHSVLRCVIAEGLSCMTKSCTMSNFQKQKIGARKLSSFL